MERTKRSLSNPICIYRILNTIWEELNKDECKDKDSIIHIRE